MEVEDHLAHTSDDVGTKLTDAGTVLAAMSADGGANANRNASNLAAGDTCEWECVSAGGEQ